MKPRTVLYSAAHGGFAGQHIPLGGGAAVSDLLMAEWTRTAPFSLELLSPAILGADAPGGRDIVRFNERAYAAFCDRFREAVTIEVLRHDPASTAVLVNDISEGPDFARLAEAGFRIVTIYHVDVVAYIAAIYLRGRVRPAALTRWWEWALKSRLANIAPRILRLIFAQQRASLLHSAAVVVPSPAMKEVLLECYPQTAPGKIHVLPWGAPPSGVSDAEAREAAAELRKEFAVPDDARVILCLSRISPEKGQDLLLESFAEWESAPGFPEEPVWLFVCGEAAFMQGQAHMEKLRKLAARLQRVKVVFPGFVSGVRKQGFFRLADLYAFPSRHESYGLTLMEALSAGLPAVCLDSPGSREVMKPDFGRTVSAADPRGARVALREEIAALLHDPRTLQEMGAVAARHAAERPFSLSAARLAELLRG